MTKDFYSTGFYLEGHTIAVRQPIEEDFLGGKWSSWYNQYDITKYNRHGIFPITIDDELNYFQASSKRNDTILFSVIEVDSQELIGNANLSNIDFINRKCNIGITLGQQAGISAGVEVLGLLVEHAFCRLNMNRVGSATHEGLEMFVKMLGTLGFKQEGRSAQHFFRDGKFSDSIHFALLASDFFTLRNSRKDKILFENIIDLNSSIVSQLRNE